MWRLRNMTALDGCDLNSQHSDNDNDLKPRVHLRCSAHHHYLLSLAVSHYLWNRMSRRTIVLSTLATTFLLEAKKLRLDVAFPTSSTSDTSSFASTVITL